MLTHTMADRAGNVGAALITEGLLVAGARLVTFVYVIASETYTPDEAKTPLSSFVPWLLASIALVAVLLWAGLQLRSAPDGAWPRAGIAGRLVLVVALLANVATFVRAVFGVARSLDAGAEVLVAWGVAGLVAGAVAYGMVRNAGFGHPGNVASDRD